MVELDNMKMELLTYEIPLAEVKDSLDLESKSKRIEELEMEMQAPNFWDDPEVSNRKMKESKVMKDIVDTMNGLSTQFDDILTLIEMGYEEEDPDMISEIRSELQNRTFKALNDMLFVGNHDFDRAIFSLALADQFNNKLVIEIVQCRSRLIVKNNRTPTIDKYAS